MNAFHSLLPHFCFSVFLAIHRILQNLFHRGKEFFPEPFQNAILFGCLSIFYFLIISVTGTSNWEQSCSYLHRFPREGCSDLYQSLTKTPKPKRGFLYKGEYTPAIICLRSAWTKVRRAHKYMENTLSWCFKKLSKRLWCFYSTYFYNLKITTCSYSGTRILEKEESVHFSLFCHFTDGFFKVFKLMLMSFSIKDWPVLTSPGFALP